MTTELWTLALFCRVDDTLRMEKHPQAVLYPSEITTLALLYAIKGRGQRAFYRWLVQNLGHLFPQLPERTRLFRLFRTHRFWAEHFLAKATTLGVIDSYGIEFIHPWREGRTPNQIGKKGLSNHRWIVGGKLCLLLNQWGLVVDWDLGTANEHDTVFQPLIARWKEKMIVLADGNFHARAGDPPNLKLCARGEWNVRMLVETVLSMLTVCWQFKRMPHREWDYFEMHLAFALAAFNLLAAWEGLQPDENGFIPLSIAQLTL
ncbi:MAG TPA: hypothetical protein VHG28_08125 [Longimicrobiaceae bacterium]|jgi:hypothetical protein|nr:hypothetical protein [Longimicrobiaceae bacterium]